MVDSDKERQYDQEWSYDLVCAHVCACVHMCIHVIYSFKIGGQKRLH